MRFQNLRILTILAPAIPAFSAPAHADPQASATVEPSAKARRFSISLSGGIRPDMAGLGDTILQDGSIDTADTTMANMVYGTDQALMSDRNNMTLASNSAATESVFKMLDDYQTGGAMLGMELGADLRYEFDDLIRFPLFMRAGFYYSTRVSGGEQSRTLGDAATANGMVAALLFMNGEDPNDYIGGTMATTWDASWIEIPVSVGISSPVHRPLTLVYGSAGLSWFNGGFSVGMDVDEKYANVLATHIDAANLTITNLSPGAVNDTVRFSTSAVGLNYGLGAQAGIGRRMAVFLELNSSGAAKTVFSEGLKPETQQLLTATSSQDLHAGDDSWFENLAYPVLFGGATARLGVRCYLF